jgi:hypothetical protein
MAVSMAASRFSEFPLRSALHRGEKVDVRRKGGGLLGSHVHGQRGEASFLNAILEKEMLFPF